MPKLILAIVDKEETAKAMLDSAPLSTVLAAADINAEELRTWPIESIIEFSIRPPSIAVIRAWRDKQRRT